MNTLIFLIGILFLGSLIYFNTSLFTFICAAGVFLYAISKAHFVSLWVFVPLFALLVAITVVFLFPPLRRHLVSRHIFKLLSQFMPNMSQTEREALTAGTVGFEGEIYSGQPSWDKLYSIPKPSLTDEEREFIAGPVHELCSMIDDWDITHNRTDMPASLWDFAKKTGFFGLIIPKEFGGKDFSAHALCTIFSILYGRSVTVATTISVPSSLGPAELLLKYGTEDQKNYYLPRLASGEDIPCFALTAPRAGSDAASITDTGIVCKRVVDGREVLGIELNFKKRYITLAPIASIIGLAFRLYDPNHYLGEESDLGITCALLPRSVEGIEIGRRHFPLNTAFLNGPIIGTNVFISLDHIIGGPKMAGQGWRMLMECLGAGRAISLPSSALGGSQAVTLASGAYARIRRQFNTSIGRFEGIEEPLARIAANTYIINAAVKVTASLIDEGASPSVASAIVKYHTTELGRLVANDAMDIHGGKAICMGPKNYLARGYQATPIGITVEGANILTRNLIIFGQGAIRCHPYLYSELEACNANDLIAFDKAFFAHVGFSLSNQVRAFVTAITHSYCVRTPKTRAKRYFQVMTRFSCTLASVSEIALMTLGGDLKRRERISARLGDVLSYLYLTSCVLKQYKDDGEPLEDWPVIRYAVHDLLHKTQQTFISIIANFPNPIGKFYLKCLLFPFSKRLTPPRDYLAHQVAGLMIEPSATRERLTAEVYRADLAVNPIGQMEALLPKLIAVEPLLKILRDAVSLEKIAHATIYQQIHQAVSLGILSDEEATTLIDAEQRRDTIIAVDDFDHADLARVLDQKKKDEVI